MRSVTFKYISHGRIYVPVIPVLIKGKSGWKEILAYVNSGASYSIFSSDEAAKLGLDYSKGREGMTLVGDGSFIPVFFHKLKIQIGNILLKADIAFSPRLGVGFNLLGRKSIFDKFEVTFNDPGRFVKFRQIR